MGRLGERLGRLRGPFWLHLAPFGLHFAPILATFWVDLAPFSPSGGGPWKVHVFWSLFNAFLASLEDHFGSILEQFSQLFSIKKLIIFVH